MKKKDKGNPALLGVCRGIFRKTALGKLNKNQVKAALKQVAP
jgi:hypothetical protein